MSSEPMAAQAAQIPEDAAPGGTVYTMSADGRRTAMILLLGVVAVWIFALWTLVTQAQGGLSGPEWVTAILMLGILLVAPVVGWNLLEERATTITADAGGLTYRSLPGIALRYTWPEITGLDRAPAGPARWARWFMDAPAPETTPLTLAQSPPAGPIAATTQQINHSHASPTVQNDDPPAGAPPPPPPAEAEDRDQDAYEATQRTIPVQVSPPPAARLTQPLIRALWRQAHGATVPLPAGLERRADLVATIRAQLSLPESPPPA